VGRLACQCVERALLGTTVGCLAEPCVPCGDPLPPPFSPSPATHPSPSLPRRPRQPGRGGYALRAHPGGAAPAPAARLRARGPVRGGETARHRAAGRWHSRQGGTRVAGFGAETVMSCVAPFGCQPTEVLRCVHGQPLVDRRHTLQPGGAVDAAAGPGSATHLKLGQVIAANSMDTRRSFAELWTWAAVVQGLAVGTWSLSYRRTLQNAASSYYIESRETPEFRDMICSKSARKCTHPVCANSQIMFPHSS